MEKYLYISVLTFKTTMHFIREILDFSGTNITFTRKEIQKSRTKAYELTNLIVDTFLKLLVFSGNQ